jgi:DNA primase
MISLSDIFTNLDARVVLQDIIGVGELIENGDEYIHSCPLPFGMHKNGDSNPSASLNKDTLLFNCFTCGGGSVIWLVQNCLNVTKDEAISVLKNEVTELKVISIEDFTKKLEGVFGTVQQSKTEIPIYSENLLNRWQGTCDYLTVRGVSEAVQREMRTGVERARPEISKVQGEEHMVTLDRVVLPHFMKGKLIGWVARKIEDVPGVPKYRNSKGFPRGSWLYNLDNNLNSDHVYVVESPMSVLVLKSRGIDNVVATFGAKVDNQQINLLRRFSKVTIFMDGDAPGRAATQHLVDELSCYTKLAIIETPDDEDPATLLEIPSSMNSMEWQLTHQGVA